MHRTFNSGYGSAILPGVTKENEKSFETPFTSEPRCGIIWVFFGKPKGSLRGKQVSKPKDGSLTIDDFFNLHKEVCLPSRWVRLPYGCKP